MNYFRGRRASLEVSEERGAPAMRYPLLPFSGQLGDQPPRLFRGAPARADSGLSSPKYGQNSRSSGALLSVLFAAKHDDP